MTAYEFEAGDQRARILLLTAERRAHHEAGHAVAAVARGERLVFITLQPTGDLDAMTRYTNSGDPVALAFISYAGAWAEARYGYARDSGEGAVDEEDLSDRLDEVFLGGGGFNHWVELGEFWDTLAGATPEVITRIVRAWNRELENAWSVMQRVAELTLADEKAVTHEVVESLLSKLEPWWSR